MLLDDWQVIYDILVVSFSLFFSFLCHKFNIELQILVFQASLPLLSSNFPHELTITFTIEFCEY